MHAFLFTERQRFRQWWFILILLAPTGIVLYGFVHQVLLGHPFGSKPAPDTVLTGCLTGLVLMDILLLSMSLETRIDDLGVHFRWRPFMANYRTITWGQIKEAELLRYPFVGYGLRFSLRYGMVHNVAGQMGLRLLTSENKKLIIGTQKPDELKQVLAQFKS